MNLKTQDTRVYRGLIWIGRFYRLAGWVGLPATVLFTIWGFVSQWNYMAAYSYGRGEMLSRSLGTGLVFLLTGLFLTAVAFGISLGIQVGLTLMKNSQTQIDLLRRIAQQQSEADNVLRLEENTQAQPEIIEDASQQQRRRA